jgi:hypothetical protein
VITRRRSAAESQFRRLGIRGLLVLAGTLTLLTVLAGPLILLTATRAQAQPRMISYGYPNCLACHVSVQGRGLLNSYGRGIEIAQSYSKKDLTAILFGRTGNTEDASGNWDGRFGNVLADFIFASRLNQRFESAKTDPTLAALYRQVVFLGENDAFRINAEVGFLDSGLPDTSLGPNRVATGGDALFLKKALLEWRFEQNGASGKEVAFGRDYLPLGLQIDDATTFILHLNRDGVYDFPLQLKYFVWNEKSLASIYAYGPTFQEPEDHREYGGGFLYERYPTSHLALGVQGLAGIGNESDRARIGPYARWGITNKWALLAEADYSFFWNAGPPDHGGYQVTAYLQLFYHHYEWLVSSVTANYAYTDFSIAKSDLSSLRCTTAARLNRNFTVGVTYAVGDILRDLGYAQELGIFATVKF